MLRSLTFAALIERPIFNAGSYESIKLNYPIQEPHMLEKSIFKSRTQVRVASI